MSFHSTSILSPTGPQLPELTHNMLSWVNIYILVKRVNEKSKGGSWPRVKMCEGIFDDDHQNGTPRRCYFPAFVVGFFVLLSFVALVLWAVANIYKRKNGEKKASDKI
ncbi:hypothetical protein R6Q59_031592 [Mikania micrantha]